MIPGFEIKLDLENFGGMKKLVIIPKSRHYEVRSDGSMISSLCKIKDHTWIQLEGNCPQELIERIGDAIDKNFSGFLFKQA